MQVANERGAAGRRGKGRPRRRKKQCIHCADPRARGPIDYKNLDLIRQFIDDRGRIRKARQTGNCRKHQSQVALAIKRAREMALVEYTAD